METKRVYVTGKHINESDECPLNCMVANALKDAGFTGVIVTGTTIDIELVEDLPMPPRMKKLVYQWGTGAGNPQPFHFDVFMEDGKAVKIGEAVDTVEEDCSDLISDIEAMLSSEFQKEVAL